MTGEIKHGGRPSGHVNGSHFGITHFGALSAAPTAYIEGDKYYDSVLLTEKIWNGSTWTSIGGVVGNGNAAGNILKFNEYLNNTCCNTVRSFGYITNDKKIRVIGFGLNKRFNAQNSSTYFPGIELQLPPEENEIPSKLYIQFTERVWVLCESGNVYAAGLNTRGEFSYEDSTILTDNPVLKKSSVTNVKKMTFGEAECYSAYYLTNAGELYCAGHNQFGQIGDGTTTTTGAAGAKLTLGPGNTYGNSTLEVTDVIAIGGFDGANHYGSVCAILSDGTVRTVGYGGRGQMGNGTNTAANTSWINPSLSGITKVGTTGYDSTTSFYALDADDTLHGWGDNDGYHLNTGGTADVLSPSAVTSGVSNFWAPNGTQALYVKDTSGDIYAIGKNANGELGLGVGAATTITTLTEVTSLSAYDVSEIVTTGTNIAGTMTNFVVTTDNKILVAGHNLQGQTGRITAENKLEEFELVKSTLNNSNYVSIKSGFNKDAPYLSNQYLQSLGGWSHILDDNSYVHGAGYNYLGVLGRDPAENLQFFSFTKIDYT
jgi:alpha-tubulin suppressor-like RCC1 family protein